MISNIIQIVLAIFIIILLYIIAYYTFNNESMNIVRIMSGSKAKKIEIFKGIYDFTEREIGINTYNNNYTNGPFRELIPSINQYGGAEYTYSFWLKIDSDKLMKANTTIGNQKMDHDNIVLFLRGDKKLIKYKPSDNSNCLLEKMDKYILVKNPLIRMKKDGSSIIVEYNSVSNPDTYREDGIGTLECESNWNDNNKGLLGIYNINKDYNKKWFMFTVVLQEITPEDDILNRFRTRCKIYLNGINMLNRIVEAPFNGQDTTSYGSAAMKHNRGKLYINPGNLFNTEINNEMLFTDNQESQNALQMSDLSYFNYALEQDEIIKLFKKGFTKEDYTIKEETNEIEHTIAKINMDNIKKFPDGY